MQLDTEIEISVLSCFYLSKRRQMQLHFQPICTGRGLFLPFKKKADATENGEERVAKSCFYLSKRRQMQPIVHGVIKRCGCFYLSKRRQMQLGDPSGKSEESCFYLSKRRQMQRYWSIA